MVHGVLIWPKSLGRAGTCGILWGMLGGTDHKTCVEIPRPRPTDLSPCPALAGLFRRGGGPWIHGHGT